MLVIYWRLSANCVIRKLWIKNLTVIMCSFCIRGNICWWILPYVLIKLTWRYWFSFIQFLWLLCCCGVYIAVVSMTLIAEFLECFFYLWLINTILFIERGEWLFMLMFWISSFFFYLILVLHFYLSNNLTYWLSLKGSHVVSHFPLVSGNEDFSFSYRRIRVLMEFPLEYNLIHLFWSADIIPYNCFMNQYCTLHLLSILDQTLYFRFLLIISFHYKRLQFLSVFNLVYLSSIGFLCGFPLQRSNYWFYLSFL